MGGRHGDRRRSGSLLRSSTGLVGPVWFNDRGLNGKMKWTVQLDANF